MLRFIFVNQSWIIHSVLNFIVRLFTSGKYGHVAVNVNDKYIIEATHKGVSYSDAKKYDRQRDKVCINFPLTDIELKECNDLAAILVNAKIGYGYDDCIIGGLNDALGKKVGDLFERLDNDKTLDCSGVGTLFARILFPTICGKCFLSEITPEDLRKVLETKLRERFTRRLIK